MANQTINKIQINENPETYDVEDTQARQNILDLTQKTNQLKEDLDNFIPIGVNENYEANYLTHRFCLNDNNVEGSSVGAITEAEIGSALTFNTATNHRHYHVNVTEGEQYLVTVRISNNYPCIVLTDDNNIVKKIVLNGVMDLVRYEKIYVYIPNGVTRLHCCSQENAGPADWNDNSKIWKYRYIGEERLTRVSKSDNTDLMLGYLQNTGGISTSDIRFTTYRYFHVKKGDRIRCVDNRLQMSVQNYDENKIVKVQSSGWYSPIYIPDNNVKFGDYIAQYDGYVRMTFAVVGALQSPVDLSLYDDVVHIIHMADNSTETAYRRTWITPKGNIKYKKFTETSSVYMQSVTMIKGYLWVFCDDYSGNENSQWIEVFNSSGNKVNTIYTDFGHCNATSYDEESDNLLFAYEGSDTDVRKRLYVYHAPNRTAERLSTNDDSCTVIYMCQVDGSTDIQSGATVVFGSNPQEIYLADDYYYRDSNYNKPIFYKIQLGLGSNNLYTTGGYGVFNEVGENEYNGTCKIVKKYDGELLQGVDTHIEYSNFHCVNDMIYDGYLYCAVDTSGHNYIIVDLDDETESYKIIGNYFTKIYDCNYNYRHLEPEGITLSEDGTKFYTGLRNTTNSDAIIVEFNRTV